MDNMESPSNNEEEIERAEIDDLVQALHTWYEFANMPSMKIAERHSNGEVIPDFGKSTVEFKRRSSVADKSFREGKNELAADEYTECLSYAETKEELAYAYANRSAALFERCMYRECQRDIRLALHRNYYPQDKWDTLVERYKDCNALMDEAKDSKEKALKVNAGFVEQDMNVESSKLRKEFGDSLLRKPSNKIRLECNETWGRHMIATEDIKPGEILSCEKYFSLVIAKEENYLRCSYCTSMSEALLPCEFCSKAMYCSIYCRIRAWNLYHDIECRVIRNNELGGVLGSTDWLALRMLLTGTNQGAGLETLMKKLPVRDIFVEKIDPTTPNKPFTSDYIASLRLCRTFPKPLLVFNSKPGVVIRLIIALQKAGYFANCSTQHRKTSSQKLLTDTELFAALLLVNHMVSVPTCTFPIIKARKNLETEGNVGIAILHSMINHSCDPNSFFVTRFNENMLFAKRPILKDEQIFVAYQRIDFRYNSLRTRQILLADPFAHFRFTCKCAACVGHWPKTDEIDIETEEQFVGANFKTEVKNFNDMIDVLLKTGFKRMNTTEILHLISRVCEWLYLHFVNKSSPAITKGDFVLMLFILYLHDFSTRYTTGDTSELAMWLHHEFSAIKEAVNRPRRSNKGLTSRSEDVFTESQTRFRGKSSRTRKR